MFGVLSRAAGIREVFELMSPRPKAPRLRKCVRHECPHILRFISTTNYGRAGKNCLKKCRALPEPQARGITRLGPGDSASAERDNGRTVPLPADHGAGDHIHRDHELTLRINVDVSAAPLRPLFQNTRTLPDGQPDARPGSDGSLKYPACHIEVVASVEHQLDPPPVPAPLFDFVEIALVGIDRVMGFLVEDWIGHGLRIVAPCCAIGNPLS